MTVSNSNLVNIFSDRKRLIETLVLIENKDRQLVPFKLNYIQNKMYTESTWRDVYVKPAQVGGTSFIECDFLLDCLTIPGTTSVIISYDEFITGRLLRKAQSFYDNLAQVIPSIPKLHHRSSSEKTFVFEDSMGVKRGESSFYIASARGFSMPRGEPIHNLLFDEIAFWVKEAVKEAFAAALQRVPLRAGTKVRVLSTPNGEDNDFTELYLAAKEGKASGNSVFTAHFYPWYIMPEYELPFDNEFALSGDDVQILTDIDEDEKAIVAQLERHDVSLVTIYNKLRWRRYKIAEMRSLKRSGETALLFKQEYPEDDVSCFQSSAGQWYDSEDINRLARDCYPAPSRHLEANVWYPPEEGKAYLLAIDPGLGKRSESVATAWTFTQTEYKHCATFSGLYAGKEMAEKCFPIARYYNNATIANEDSLDITSHLVSYPNLYHRIDQVTGKVSNNIGWQTNASTKVFMCNEMRRSLSLIKTHDSRIVSQLRNIRESMSRGRLIPVSAGADDYHDSAAIAVVCRASIPVERGFVGAKGWTQDWGT